jgi:sugar phosphate isomerase/epimerase
MYPAIFGKTYTRPTVSEVLAAAAEDGFSGVQFNLVSAHIPSLPDHLPEGLAEKIGDCAQKMGIRIAALSGTYNMAHPDPLMRTASRPKFLNVVEAARRMGAPVVTLCTGSRDASDMWKPHPDNASDAAWVDLRKELEFALSAAEAANIKLGIEPEPGNVVRDAKTAYKLLVQVSSSRLGIVLDAANLLSPQTLALQDSVIQEATDLLGDQVLVAHAKDIDAAGQVVAAGEGAVHLLKFVTALRAAGFHGALIGHGFGAEKARSVAKFLFGLVEATA